MVLDGECSGLLMLNVFAGVSLVRLFLQVFECCAFDVGQWFVGDGACQ